jgi:hypothetical protein
METFSAARDFASFCTTYVCLRRILCVFYSRDPSFMRIFSLFYAAAAPFAVTVYGSL